MSGFFEAEWICSLKEYVMGTVEDRTVGAVDRFFKSTELLQGTSDSAAVQAAMSELQDQALSYANGQLDAHVPTLKSLRDGVATLDKPCALVNTWSALSSLNDAMNQLEADGRAGTFDAAHRVEALEAAGDAIDALGNIMALVPALQGFGEFLNAFIGTAWNPLTQALGLKFRQWQWLDESWDPLDGFTSPQPT